MSGQQRALLYGIIAAVITGLFSIAPKLYDIIIEPSARLLYTVTKGPELVAESQCRRITAVKVLNSGKKALHNVQVGMSLPSGEFETFRVQESTGLRPEVSASKTTISADISTLHPGEGLIVIAMELISTPSIATQLNVRSDEVLGTLEPESGKKRRYSDVIGAILSGFSVLVMSFILWSKRLSLFRNEREDNIFRNYSLDK